MRILVTGGNGYIARSIYHKYKDIYDITLLTKNDVDLVDAQSTKKWFSSKFFDCVIHTAIKGGNRLVPDTGDVLDYNLYLYYNLLSNKNHYNRFINFGSGAELYAVNTPYGMSKSVISKSINDKPNFYNIRIFAVFDENESERRFIKSNIIRYINKQPLIVHKNKLMDFFYMEDLTALVQYYIEAKTPPKSIDCAYLNSFTLHNIATEINNLASHKCDIYVNTTGMDNSYTGIHTPLLDYVGLNKGIKNMYTFLSK